MTENNLCAACGAPISPEAVTCPRCRVSLAPPEPARVAREIVLYVALFVVVALALVATIMLRKIYFFRIILQVIGPFVVLFALGFFLKRHLK
jgi:predicted nucleic acid-binding Zn ribbon protein